MVVLFSIAIAGAPTPGGDPGRMTLCSNIVLFAERHQSDAIYVFHVAVFAIRYLILSHILWLDTHAETYRMTSGVHELY